MLRQWRKLRSSANISKRLKTERKAGQTWTGDPWSWSLGTLLRTPHSSRNLPRSSLWLGRIVCIYLWNDWEIGSRLPGFHSTFLLNTRRRPHLQDGEYLVGVGLDTPLGNQISQEFPRCHTEGALIRIEPDLVLLKAVERLTSDVAHGRRTKDFMSMSSTYTSMVCLRSSVKTLLTIRWRLLWCSAVRMASPYNSRFPDRWWMSSCFHLIDASLSGCTWNRHP